MPNETSPATRPARAPHPVNGTSLSFDLAAEADKLRREPTWQARGHNAKPLVKHPDFRVVLIALRAGARMSEHKPDHCVTLHALEGTLRLHLPDGTVVLAGGSLLALEQTVLHVFVAISDSLFVLSLGWSKTAAAT